MKWIGQHIWDFISRFRTTVYFENLETSSEENVLVVDSDGKVTKNTTLGGSDLTLTNASDNRIITSTGGTGLTAESDFTFEAATSLAAMSWSGAGNLPEFRLSNTNSGTSGAMFRFEKTDSGTAGDVLGNISFSGDDDAGDSAGSYASIVGKILNPAAGSERGKLEFKVLEYDGTLTDGLIISGGDTDNTINTTIGGGINSLTTIAGSLNFSSSSVDIAASSYLDIKSNGNMGFVIDEDNNSTSNDFFWCTNGASHATRKLMNLSDEALLTVGGQGGTAGNITIENLVDDANGPTLTLHSQRGTTAADSQDDDVLGQINFSGYDDGTPSTQSYANIKSTIADATSGQEAGKLELQVAEYDGTVTTGLTLDGNTDADGEVDVTVGAGVNSVTTIAGDLDIDGSLLNHGHLPSGDFSSYIQSAAPASGWASGSNDGVGTNCIFANSRVTAGSQTNTFVGTKINIDDTASHTGTIDYTGLDINIDFLNTNGTQKSKGVSTIITDGDTTDMYGLWQQIEDGGTDLYFQSSDTTTVDYFSIKTGASGATTIGTVDGGGADADITLKPDGILIFQPLSTVTELGDVSNSGANLRRMANSSGVGGKLHVLAGAGGGTDQAGGDLELKSGRATGSAAFGDITFFCGEQNASSGTSVRANSLVSKLKSNASTSTDQYWYEKAGASENDYFKLSVAEHGATTLSTVDGNAEEAHLNVVVDGDVTFKPDSSGEIQFLDNSGATKVKIAPNSASSFYNYGLISYFGTASALGSVIYKTPSPHDAAGGGLTIYAGSPTAGTTNDLAGGALTLAGGQGKGTGAGGKIEFKVAPPALGSGSSLNSYVTPMTITSDGGIVFTPNLTATNTFWIDNNAHASNTVDIDAGILDIDADDNVTIDAADLITLTTADTGADGKISLVSGVASDNTAIHLDGNADAASIVDIDAGVLDIDVTGATTLTSGSNFNVEAGRMILNVDASGDSAENKAALFIDFDRTVAGSGTAAHNDIGIDLDVNSASLGTSSAKGIDVDVVGATSGTHTLTGVDVNVSGGDYNVGLEITVPDTANDHHIKLTAADDTNDRTHIDVANGGDLTVETIGNSGSLILDIAGNIELNADGGDINFKDDSKLLANIGNHASTTVQAGEIQVNSRKFDITSSTVGDFQGDVVYIGSTSTTIGQLYYLRSTGAWAPANAGLESTSVGMLGIALGDDSSTKGMLVRGMVTISNDPGAFGDTLYISETNGEITSAKPSDANDVIRVVGYCLHATNKQIWFDPDKTWIKHA
tara:strand:- start:1918 stop:5721 length:3804 start_codon:yes stop_codon:yes gene_type:complete